MLIKQAKEVPFSQVYDEYYSGESTRNRERERRLENKIKDYAI